MNQRIPFSVCVLSVSVLAFHSEYVSAGEFRQSYRPVTGQYIVVMKGGSVFSSAEDSARVDAKEKQIRGRFKGISVSRKWVGALDGLTISMRPAQAKSLSRDPDVVLVEQDSRVSINTTQSPAVWGLDRIDQSALPLTSSYSYSATASGVTAYVIDTGIFTSHADFGGRASNGFSAITTSAGDADYADCNGHGTHVAGTIGSTTFGVAKGVKLVNVRVLDCAGSGTISGVISGVDWVTRNRILPAVANMSLGGGVSSALDLAVKNSIAAGVTYAIAAGNSNVSACTSSPGDVPEALTVGATDSADTRASFSNFGSCLDLFAPGVNITSAWYTSTNSTASLSGTSMAAPHAAGAAALYLADNPGAVPSQVVSALVTQASAGKVSNAGTGSPNRLLFTNPQASPPVGDTTPPTVQLTAPTAAQSLSGTVTLSADATDNAGVSKVDFRVDGTLVSTDTSAPYAVSWDSTSVADGSHAFTAEATDSAGLTSASTAVQATVSNASAPTPVCGTSSQLINNPGFESGAVSWTTNRVSIITESGAYPAFSGNWKAVLGGAGVTSSYTLSQQVNIPVNACSAVFRFQLRVQSAETTTRQRNDTLTFRVVDPRSGKVIGTANSFSNLNASNAYAEVKYDLLSFKGKTIRLEFVANENSRYATSFLVDETALNITQ